MYIKKGLAYFHILFYLHFIKTFLELGLYSVLKREVLKWWTILCNLMGACAGESVVSERLPVIGCRWWWCHSRWYHMTFDSSAHLCRLWLWLREGSSTTSGCPGLWGVCHCVGPDRRWSQRAAEDMLRPTHPPPSGHHPATAGPTGPAGHQGQTGTQRYQQTGLFTFRLTTGSYVIKLLMTETRVRGPHTKHVESQAVFSCCEVGWPESSEATQITTHSSCVTSCIIWAV